MTTSRWHSFESPTDLPVLGRISRFEGQERSAICPRAMAAKAAGQLTRAAIRKISTTIDRRDTSDGRRNTS